MLKLTNIWLFSLAFICPSIFSQEATSLNGKILPKTILHPNQRISYSIVIVTTLSNEFVDSTYADINGHYKISILPKYKSKLKNDSLKLFVSTRYKQDQITYDSICPYFVLKNPSYYYDIDEKLVLNNTGQINDIQLTSPIIDMFGYSIYFKKNSSEFYKNTNSSDTVCLCIFNSFKKTQAKGLKLTLKVQLPASVNMEGDSINNLRKKAITQSLNKYFIELPIIIFEENGIKNENGFYDVISLNLVSDWKKD